MEYDDVFEYDEWEDIEDEEEMRNLRRLNRVPKRYIRNQENPMDRFTNEEFKGRFRFSKETVLNTLVPMVYPTPLTTSNKGLPIAPLLRILIALRYFATASQQIVCGDLFNVSQPTVSRILKEVSERIARLIARFIRMPRTRPEVRAIHSAFYRKANFPGVIGLIDGTHIPIISPGGNDAEVFRNRKGYLSINCQIVCGPNEEILDIVTRWPGSAHDARVFESSGVRVLMEEQTSAAPLGHLLGDSGYAQRSYMFTPLLNPTTDAEITYNRAHKVTRSLVERTIGRWKRRFPCLYFEMHTKLRTTLRIITACAILYNIGIQVGDVWDEDETANENELQERLTVQLSPAVSRQNGIMYRNTFIIRHFR